MRIGVLTREWPDQVYGGAGVHVEYLVRALRAEGAAVDVHSFGGTEDGAQAHEPDPRLGSANAALQVLGVDLSMVAGLERAELAHSHTWYANMAGHLAKLLYGIPHVVTAHSLEPDRPWKAEQLGGGYRLSSWAEKTAYEGADAVIGVSEGMPRDILRSYPTLDPAKVHVIYNGIDTVFYHPDPARDALAANGIDPDQPSVVFVGRITRQKGVGHLVAAAHEISRDAQIVLCAGAPDTPEIQAEVEGLVASLAESRDGVVWIREMLPRPDVVVLLSAATAFACPSIYEPLGIVNLEAMACETAVVTTNTLEAFVTPKPCANATPSATIAFPPARSRRSSVIPSDK